MFPKAYRWVAEMEEIAAFCGDGTGAADIYRGASALYAHLARDMTGPRADVERLEAFLRSS
jgi:L-threonate 2-dehydrogenase